MTFTRLAQLEASANELVSAVKCLTNFFGNVEPPIVDGNVPPPPLVPPKAPSDVHRARRSILSNIAKLQKLLSEPAGFLQQLSKQIQYLACLNWLGEFQVLACIPLSHSVPLEDVADLAGVPQKQLRCVVRMMATVGFLHEPKPGHVAHSSLSAPFVTKPSYLDAAMFVSQTAAPVASQMAAATRRFGNSQRPNETAYNLAFKTSTTFTSACEQQPKLQRQWPAYFRYVMGDEDAGVLDILPQFNWFGLGDASVIEVGAQSRVTVMALADLYPALQFIVQMSESRSKAGETPRQQQYHQRQQQQRCSRITVHQRASGTPQNIHHAAVYIIRLPSPSPWVLSHSIPARMIAEIRAHLSIVRANGATMLILAPHVLPEPGSVDPEVEAVARLRDLSLLQLANGKEMEMAELMDTLRGVRESMGQLVLVNKLHSGNSASVALEVRYQSFGHC